MTCFQEMEVDIFVQTPTGLVDFALMPLHRQAHLTSYTTEPELSTMTATGLDAGLISNTKFVRLSGISDTL